MRSYRALCALLLIALAAATTSVAQDRTKGSLKGKVRDEREAGVSGVAVTAQQGEREVAHATTNRKGEFLIEGLAPGRYALTFRKPGLSTGTVQNIEVRAGKTSSLPDRLILRVDEGSIAFLRGSVFTPEGRSVRGARVELARLEANGVARKIDGRQTSESGEFVFRLTPDAARYRVTVKADGAEPASKDVEIDGAAVYRVALSLQPAQK
ncbi:MAG TPA: carboxypeptidase-like regulatory domain-containing protein [Pyrinomonadaceae bacterium]